MLRAGVLLLALASSAPARAQDASCAAPVHQDDVRALVEAAHDALLGDDAAAHAALVGRLRAAVPCLAEPLPSGAWARLLYEWALVRHAAGEPWHDLVVAALAADPGLERRFGVDEVRTWSPPASATPFSAPDPTPGRWLLDGREVDGPFHLVGPRVLQERLAGGGLVSLLVEDGALPASWAPRPPVARPEPTPAAPVEPAASAPVAAVEAASTRAPIEVGRQHDRLALRVHVATGILAAFGDRVEADGAAEPATKLVVPVEAGLSFEPRHGFVRLTGEFTPIVRGTWVYEADEEVRATHFGGGGALAGGGRIGIGHVGAHVGLRDPSRAVFAAVGGVEVHRVGLRVEGRAGVNLTTADVVEPTVAVLVAFAPAVWRR